MRDKRHEKEVEKPTSKIRWLVTIAVAFAFGILVTTIHFHSGSDPYPDWVHTFFITGSVAALTWLLASRQQDLTFQAQMKHQRDAEERAASRAVKAETRAAARALKTESRADKRQRKAEQRAEQRQKDASDLARREQDHAFANQEKRRALTERYARQCAVYEEYLAVFQEAYRGPVEPKDRNARSASWQPFKARVMFAFGNEKLAISVIGVLTVTEMMNFSMTHERPPEYPTLDWYRDNDQVLALMLRAVNVLAKELDYPPIDVSPHTERYIASLDGPAASPPPSKVPAKKPDPTVLQQRLTTPTEEEKKET